MQNQKSCNRRRKKLQPARKKASTGDTESFNRRQETQKATIVNTKASTIYFKSFNQKPATKKLQRRAVDAHDCFLSTNGAAMDAGTGGPRHCWTWRPPLPPFFYAAGTSFAAAETASGNGERRRAATASGERRAAPVIPLW